VLHLLHKLEVEGDAGGLIEAEEHLKCTSLSTHYKHEVEVVKGFFAGTCGAGVTCGISPGRAAIVCVIGGG
jgi:hypothetical protein